MAYASGCRPEEGGSIPPPRSKMKIYNSLTKKKEEFKTLRPGEVRIYTCGQTVYEDLHVGNACTYCRWDVLTRYLRWKGYNVKHVQNFTDVGHLTSDADEGEDKIEKKSRTEKVDPWELVDALIRRYYEDTDNLNIQRPNIMPRASSHIPEMISLIKKLIENGYAYESNGSVYYDISKFKDYDKLFLVSKGGEFNRVTPNKEKKDGRDFALWQNAHKEDGKLHIMNWDSPCGKGYPGWHIECSVMAMKYLGETIDIHGGGYDHLFLHHPNEIAQSEAATGKKFAKYWMHSYFLTINNEKMSKSKGNFKTARELIEKYGGETLKMFCISAHYRTQLNYSEEAVIDAKEKMEKIYNMIAVIESSNGGNKTNLEKAIKETKNKFENAMDDDLNTPLALAAIFELIKETHKNLDNKKAILNKAKETIIELARVLGLKIERKEEMTDRIMKVIINIRDNARKNKDYKTSDTIRKELSNIGIQLDDSKEGVIWKLN